MRQAPHPVPASEITTAGGAYVRRRFGDFTAGDRLTAEQVASIPRANINALINTGMIELWPAGPGQAISGAQRFMINVGKGEYIVVQGVQITDKPMSRAEAEALIKGPNN